MPESGNSKELEAVLGCELRENKEIAQLALIEFGSSFLLLKACNCPFSQKSPSLFRFSTSYFSYV